eukprot:7386567-Prymnesium_polylepis.1
MASPWPRGIGVAVMHDRVVVRGRVCGLSERTRCLCVSRAPCPSAATTRRCMNAQALCSRAHPRQHTSAYCASVSQ